MTKTKIAVTLPPQHVRAAKKAVAEGRAVSVSAYVAQALARQAQEDGLIQLVAVMRAEDGPPTDDDYAWASRVLGTDQ